MAAYPSIQGVGDILRDEDTTYGEADDDINMMLNEQAAEDAMDSAIEHYDARVLNKTAGKAGAGEAPAEHPGGMCNTS